MKLSFLKNLHNFIFLFSFLVLAIISTSAQDTILNPDSQFTDTNEHDNNAQSDIEYYKKDFIRNDNYIYKDNIKTVLLYRDGWEMTDPVFRLNSDEKLRLSFDDLDADIKNYNYTITHCDADWQTSDIRKSDYINGFQQDYIDDYQSSFNTTRHYTHYNLIFPTDYLRITKSGNYILKVFTEDDSDKNIVFTWRFMVVDPKVSVKGKIKVPTSIGDRDYKQEIDFIIFKQSYDISNPYGNLKVKIFQNGRTDNVIENLSPSMIRGNEIIYDYDKENVFNGGNEFRELDIKDFRYQSERIRKILYDENGYQIYLWNDERRPYKYYLSKEDINGKKLIQSEKGTNPDIEGDYARVHFSLPYPAPLIDGNIYVIGALTDWEFTEEGKLKYNFEKHGYETSIYLKQGFYNYLYVFLENGQTKGDVTLIEGNHFETNNEYSIYVYYHEPGTFYDKLIAVEYLNRLE